MKNLLIVITISFLSQIQLQATSITASFFDNTHSFMSSKVMNGALDYASLKNNQLLSNLIAEIEQADLTGADDATKEAFFINAYNLHVINAAAAAYPLESVQQINGFFDSKKVVIAGEAKTLNSFEKEYLLKKYQDGRLHFVLVCGALGCPPITNFAYRPELLDQQLEQQSISALNDDNFIRVNGNEVGLSKIFQWYKSDFGMSESEILDFINQYRTTPLPSNPKVKYYTYDWTLNDKANASSELNINGNAGSNSGRYIVSSTIPVGSSEIKIFNNLYSQRTGSEGELTDRSTFFTTSLSYLYGLSNKLNIGFATRYRRVKNSSANSSAFGVFGELPSSTARQGLTAFGPQIRYAPIEAWSNFSIQSSFLFAIGEDLAGSSTQPFIDWNGPTWNTQFFNDFSIGNSFSFFTEVDILIEDIGSSSNGHINRFSTPVTTIFSYNPNLNTTLYALSGFSPYWQDDFDYFYQYGGGVKYQFTPNVELEVSATNFTNKFLRETGGEAFTFNVGFRFNL